MIFNLLIISSLCYFCDCTLPGVSLANTVLRCSTGPLRCLCTQPDLPSLSLFYRVGLESLPHLSLTVCNALYPVVLCLSPANPHSLVHLSPLRLSLCLRFPHLFTSGGSRLLPGAQFSSSYSPNPAGFLPCIQYISLLPNPVSNLITH